MSQSSTMNNWYTNAYSGSFRTNRLRAPPFLPGSRLAMHQHAVTAMQQTLVVDAARQTGVGATTEGKDESKIVRRRETIFGPDVGEDDEPGWTKADEGATVAVDVVKGWVEMAKSEEGLHATTTLQALVNLKRPTLLLQQLVQDVAASSSMVHEQEGEITPANASMLSLVPVHPLHLLKFNYDATTPLVNISLSIHPTPTQDAEGKASAAEEDIKVMYSGVHEGGFNQVFTLPAEAALDLSDAVTPLAAPAVDQQVTAQSSVDKIDPNVSSVARESYSEDTNRSSLERTMGNPQVAAATEPDLETVPELGGPNATTSTLGQTPADRRAPRRFGIFPRRQREPDVEEAARIEMSNRPAEGAGAKSEEVKAPEKGMRLLIRIEAVGDGGQPIKRRNAQLTHILVTGMWSPDAGSTAPVGQAGKRVWVVKVVRREAVIGAHTFLLKEIYGLSSTQTQQPSYPPTAGAERDPYASTPNECIVCLTAPRDVVLLPCRHLVVCRDCAVGMVEFGAGGKVGRRDDPAGAATVVEDAAPRDVGAATNTAAPPVAGGTTTTGRERRKKAKGWYCPVCRQPYTSLLRLALPASAKPPRSASRPPSIRSVRSTHTLKGVPSIAPTLPNGAERMLGQLRPHGDDDEEDIQDGNQDIGHDVDSQRPQFVLGAEVDDEDHHDHQHEHGSPAGQTVIDESTKGWREVA